MAQITDCMRSDGEQENTPAFHWLHNLITAYVSLPPMPVLEEQKALCTSDQERPMLACGLTPVHSWP